MISLVICSYNGINRIESSLKAVSCLVLPTSVAVELVFVDSNSTNPMLKEIERIWSELGDMFPLKSFFQSKSGKVAAMELGFEKADGEFIVIVDDDNELLPNYLLDGYNYLKFNHHVGVLGGQGILPAEYIVPSWFEELAYNFACGPQNKVDGNVKPKRNVVYGAGMWIRKESYLKAKLNGFTFIFDFHGANQNVSELNNGGEDGELCWAIIYQGYEVHFLSTLKFIHRIDKSKFNLSHQKLILERVSKSTLLGTIYLRVSDLNKIKVSNYWIKELVYIFLMYFKNLKFSKSYFTTELTRNISNIKMLLKLRKRYDILVNKILDFKYQSQR
jgi:glycosyltransferase involved in cell wall biosynthesis